MRTIWSNGENTILDEDDMTIIQPGVYDMSNAEYHASAGISRSGISALQMSPLDYWLQYLDPNREKEPPSEAMILGTAVHTLVLEPDKFNDEFAIAPKMDLRTTIGKQQKALFESLSADKQIIKEESFELAKKMADAVLSSNKALQILNGALVEKSIFWNDRETDALCKTRPDIWNKSVSVICDLKTARDSRPRYFARTVEDGNYHIQAAMQIDGIYSVTGKRPDDFIFIVVQNVPPYDPYIYRLDDEAIETGRREYKEALRVFKECMRTNDWRRDREAILPVFFTDYQLKKSTFYKLKELYQCPI